MTTEELEVLKVGDKIYGIYSPIRLEDSIINKITKDCVYLEWAIGATGWMMMLNKNDIKNYCIGLSLESAKESYIKNIEARIKKLYREIESILPEFEALERLTDEN